jgi:chemotaxis protein CheX
VTQALQLGANGYVRKPFTVMDNEKLVAIIRSATEEVFSMMLGLPVECGTAYQEQAGDQSFDGVVGLVGLAGAYVGAGRVSCSAQFACTVSSAMLSSEFPAVNEEVLDALAEVTNMIIGNVKSHIENEFGQMGLSIPTVIYGRNYKARCTAPTGWTVVPFHSGEERMDVRLCIAPGAENAPQRADLALQQRL